VLPPVLVPSNVDYDVPSEIQPLPEDVLPENKVYPTPLSPPMFPPLGIVM
jgi:hypothetical protein